MRRQLTLLAMMGLLLLMGCENNQNIGQQTPTVAGPAGSIPAEYAKGETLFNMKCAPCHGPGAKGTDHGPPFLSKIYEPNHHADFTFHRAVQQGVQAHHWKFGNMPKIEGLTETDVNEIIAYIRWLQRQTGIF